MRDPNLSTSRRYYTLLWKIALIIFMVEGVVMLAFQWLPFDLSPMAEVISDVLLLVIFSTPFILIYAVRPYMDRWHQASAKLLESENALRVSEERFRALAHYTPNKLHIKDTEGRYILINRKSEELFGVTNEEAIGKKTVDIFPSEISKDFEEHDRAVIETGEPVEAEEEFHLDDGVHTYLTVKFPIPDANGKIVAVGASGTDITERKKVEEEKTALERELLQASKLEAVGQLASGIAHEINTPVQYINDNLNFLQESFNDLSEIVDIYQGLQKIPQQDQISAEKIKEAARLSEECDLDYLREEIPESFSQAINGVTQIARIVSAMKEFSHPASKELTRTDINKLITTTATVSRSEWKYVADLKTEFDANPLTVPCLPGEMNQVLLNLIVNASHAIGEKTEDGEDAGEAKGTITITTRKDGEWAEIRIADNGSGIPKAARDQIFTPFFTTKEVGKGTGQGLAICRDIIVNKHAGEMRFETEENKGTTFIIRIPVEGSDERVGG